MSMILNGNLPVISKSDLEFFEKLSSGGEGSVFRAEWKSMKKIVAVKRLLVLEKEAHVLSQIRHKNIVTFFGVCTTPPDYYIVTEYAEKGSLYSCLHDSRSLALDFTQIIKWALDIARGVHYLHFEAPETILHRDLKSRNVVITADDMCKLCDFGTSKPMAHSTNVGFVGTAPWMSEIQEDKDLEEKLNKFLVNKEKWQEEIRIELEILKKRQKDNEEWERALKNWETSLTLKEKNSELRPPVELKRLNSYDVKGIVHKLRDTC